jgi:hypothetical protein
MKKIVYLSVLTLAFTSLSATLSPLCKGCQKQEDLLKTLQVQRHEDILSEAELLLSLDKDGRARYQALNGEGKELARRLAATTQKNSTLAAIEQAELEQQRKSKL